MTGFVLFVASIPAWVWDHRWLLAVGGIGTMALVVLAMLGNPRGRQLRELWRRR